MNKTSEKAMTAGMLIRELEILKKELGGDPEVTIANPEEACFDGVGRVFTIHVASTGLTAIALIRGNVVLKP